MAAPRLDRTQLALELEVARPARRVELARLERRRERAVGLGRVRAVVEPALRSQLRDVGERAVDVALPDLELAQPGRVDRGSPRRA